MYLEFFGFREKPFSLTPDPRFVFLSKNHREAFAHLLYGIDNRAGFIALTGEVGSGKTTVLRALLNNLNADRHRSALIFNPTLSPSALIESINREFGLTAPVSPGAGVLDVLNSFLLQQNAEGRTVVLVIDEAQNLEARVLEQIRLISNLETDRDKLIQIVLSGQPELLQILSRNEMRQLNQRITVRAQLQPMDFEDTVAYINHRIRVAGRRGSVIFSRGALKRIYKYSRGYPRLINAACDRALLAGYTRDEARITPRIAKEGIDDLRKNAGDAAAKNRFFWIPAFVMIAALIAGGLYFTGFDFAEPFKTPPPAEAVPEEKEENPAAKGEDVSAALVNELGKISEAESARRAFNVLAGLWKVPPLPEGVNPLSGGGLERAAEERGLRFHRFSGNLGALLRLDYPAAIELLLNGVPGKRFAALVGAEEEKLALEFGSSGKKPLSSGEFEKLWTGQGVLLWKDPLNLLARALPGSRGGLIKQLQSLLYEAGTYRGPLTGVYDDGTLAAVKEFQDSRGILKDGIAGGQTLMFLYASGERFGVPRLTAGKK
jgi:general secretion pathway protein A